MQPRKDTIVSIPEGAIEGENTKRPQRARLRVSIPEGAIEGGKLRNNEIYKRWFQYPKVRLKG